MKKKRFTEQQIIGFLKEAEAGMPVIEVWDVPPAAFGGFVDGSPAPLGIGMVTPEDGQQMKGFLCETYATKGGAGHYQPGRLAPICAGGETMNVHRGIG